MTHSPKIRIAGAGSIGCYVGGMLMAAGKDVALFGRPRVADEIKVNGLTVSSLDAENRHLSLTDRQVSIDPAILSDADIVLVAVKSDDTPAVAGLIATHVPAGAVIVSLQNGVGNVPVLRDKLPGRRVLAGMVPFNVISQGHGKFHRATSGDILIERDADTAAALSVPGLTVRGIDNITGVQWGKLLVNLNNALNALSGLPLRDQLGQRAWRVLFAAQMQEALAVLKAEGIAPVSTTPLPASWTPAILRLPDGLFRNIAKPMVKIDPTARSSMWEDLQLGRRTEIDHLQGLVVQIAARHGMIAPLCAHVAALIKAAERAGKGSPALDPVDIDAV
jgi:2-dehydropantoate 2-reductase